MCNFELILMCISPDTLPAVALHATVLLVELLQCACSRQHGLMAFYATKTVTDFIVVGPPA